MASSREFLKSGAAGLGAATLGAFPFPAARLTTPAIIKSAVKPTVIASANGLRAITTAMDVLAGGGDTLEAVVRAVNIVELDPNDQTVGYGGLPNFDGVVQLDASVMHGPTRGAGAVGA